MRLSEGNVVEDLERWRELYLQNCRDVGRAERTIVIYSGITLEFTEHSRQFQGSIVIQDLNTFYVNAFLNDKAAKAVKSFNNTSRRLYINVIKSFFKFISENNHDGHDLLYGLRFLTIAKEKKVKPSYTNDQEERIAVTLTKMVANLSKTPSVAFTTLRNVIMTKIFLNTGIRGGEMAKLRYEDLEPFTEEDSGALMYQILVDGKGSRERYVYLEREEVDDELEIMRAKFGCSGLIAISRTGQPLGPVQINHNLSRIAKATGLAMGGLHIYRHTVARRLIRKGVNLEIVKQTLGHSSISTTSEFYAHTDEGSKAAAIVASRKKG